MFTLSETVTHAMMSATCSWSSLPKLITKVSAIISFVLSTVTTARIEHLGNSQDERQISYYMQEIYNLIMEASYA